ncbi:MAG: YbaN family protein [Acidobacteriota bacterium]
MARGDATTSTSEDQEITRAEATQAEAQRPAVNPLKRWLLAGAGLVFVGLGAIGVVVPGLPTTIFLILAGYCFTRSIPALEDRLIRNKWFAPYLRYVDGREEMPIGARVRALLVMWISIAASCAFLIYRELHPGIPLTVLLAGVVGTWYIWARAGRPQR